MYNFRFLSNASWDVLSDKIVELFPYEEKTSYYIPPVKKFQSKFNKSGIARGKLPDKYKNELALLREAGVLPKMETRAETDSCDEFSATVTGLIYYFFVKSYRYTFCFPAFCR